MNLNQVTVPALDVAASVDFYRRLGLELIVSSPHYARFKCPECEASFSVHLVPELAGPSPTVVYFEIEALDDKVKQLQRAGLVFSQQPQDESWLWREARLADPSGNVICLYWAGVNRLAPPWRPAQGRFQPGVAGMLPPSPRVIVIGSSCAGKSTFARSLARARDCAHIELDELFWSADWQPKPAAEFRRLVASSAQAECWVADGNYSSARHALWPRATTVVWLDLSLSRVLWRGLRRTLGRCLSRQELWHGNRESLRRAFLSRESLLLWIVTTFNRRRREFAALREAPEFAHLTWLEVRSPAETRELLRTLEAGHR